MRTKNPYQSISDSAKLKTYFNKQMELLSQQEAQGPTFLRCSPHSFVPGHNDA